MEVSYGGFIMCVLPATQLTVRPSALAVGHAVYEPAVAVAAHRQKRMPEDDWFDSYVSCRHGFDIVYHRSVAAVELVR